MANMMRRHLSKREIHDLAEAALAEPVNGTHREDWTEVTSGNGKQVWYELKRAFQAPDDVHPEDAHLMALRVKTLLSDRFGIPVDSVIGLGGGSGLMMTAAAYNSPRVRWAEASN